MRSDRIANPGQGVAIARRERCGPEGSTSHVDTNYQPGQMRRSETVMSQLHTKTRNMCLSGPATGVASDPEVGLVRAKVPHRDTA